MFGGGNNPLVQGEHLIGMGSSSAASAQQTMESPSANSTMHGEAMPYQLAGALLFFGGISYFLVHVAKFRFVGSVSAGGR
jgi:hypothetical protein